MGMQISKLNINTSSRIPSFKSNIEPSPKDNFDEDIIAANEFAQLSDDELFGVAAKDGLKRLKKTSKDIIKTAFIAVPIIDVATAGMLTKGNLSSKLKQSARQTGRWGVIMGSLAAMWGAKKAVNSRSEGLDNIDKNHPILALGMDFGAMLLAYSGIVAAKDVAVEFVKGNFAKTVSDLNRKLIEPAKVALNKSYLNKKLILPAEDKLYKHANSAGRGFRLFASLLAPTIAFTAMTKGFIEVHNIKKKVNSDYLSLKVAQESVRNMLTHFGISQDDS